MTWIRKAKPQDDPSIASRLEEIGRHTPEEYDQRKRHLRKTPPIINDDSIMLAHSLIPDAMSGIFSGYAAMLDPSLPLSRRQQEMIATVVSSLNACFY